MTPEVQPAFRIEAPGGGVGARPPHPPGPYTALEGRRGLAGRPRIPRPKSRFEPSTAFIHSESEPEMAKAKRSKPRQPAKQYQTRESADLVVVDDVLTEVKHQLAIIASRREQLSAGGFDRDLASAAAALGKVLLAGVAERRNQRKASASLSREAVMAWIRGLDEADQQSIHDELTEWMDEGSLL